MGQTLFAHTSPIYVQVGDRKTFVRTEAGELPEGADLETLLDAAAGLTRHDFGRAKNYFDNSQGTVDQTY